MKKIILLFVASAITSYALFAQAGKLDSSFGINGYVRVNPETFASGSFAGAHAVAVNKKNGKIILAGYGYEGSTSKQYQAMIRLKTDGTVDTKFGINGSVNYQPITDVNSTYFYGIQSVAIQPDNKILIAASYYYSTDTVKIVVSRFNTDGSIDGNFGSYGSVYIQYPCYGLVTCSVAVHNGKIILASSKYDDNLYQTMVAWRFNSNGTPDVSFNGTGYIDLSTYFPYWDIGFCKMQIAPNGKIILGGSGDSHGVPYRNFILVRLQTNGAPDVTFGSSGIASASFDTSYRLSCTSIALESDGDIIATGSKNTSHNARFAFIDFKPNGLLNKTFNKTGKLLLPSSLTGALNDLGIDENGRIVGTGYQYTYGQYGHAILMRLNRFGTFDSSFGKNGVVTPDSTITTNYGGLDFDSTGKIVCSANVSLAGYTVFGAARYLTNATGLNFTNNNIADAVITKQNIPSSSAMNVYPNPVKKDAVINYTLNHDDNVSIGLYDINGKLIQTILSNSAKVKGNYSQQFSLPSTLLSGSYILLLSSKTQKTSVTIIKQ